MQEVHAKHDRTSCSPHTLLPTPHPVLLFEDLEDYVAGSIVCKIRRFMKFPDEWQLRTRWKHAHPKVRLCGTGWALITVKGSTGHTRITRIVPAALTPPLSGWIEVLTRVRVEVYHHVYPIFASLKEHHHFFLILCISVECFLSSHTAHIHRLLQ